MKSAHESLLLGLSEQDFQLFRHHPIMGAYLEYLGDQIEAFRTATMDLVENGKYDQLDVIRGRLLTLRELQNLSLGDIQAFYRQPETEENGTAADQGRTG